MLCEKILPSLSMQWSLRLPAVPSPQPSLAQSMPSHRSRKLSICSHCLAEDELGKSLLAPVLGHDSNKSDSLSNPSGPVASKSYIPGWPHQLGSNFAHITDGLGAPRTQLPHLNGSHLWQMPNCTKFSGFVWGLIVSQLRRAAI